jgi:hypothetical protein
MINLLYKSIITIQMLRNLHIAAATIHLISALLSWVIHVDIQSTITLPKHIHVGKTTTTEYEVWFTTNPIIWISFNEFITMFSHVIAIFYLITHDNKQTFESPRRAVEYCITAALLQCAIMLGMGAVTAQDIIFIIVTNVALQLLGYVIDLYREAKRWLLVIGFLLLISQMQYIIFNAARIEGISTGYYNVMAIIYVLFYTGFGVLKLIDPPNENEIYVVMSLTTKVVLSWVLIGNLFEGFKELGETTSPDYTHLDWRAIQISLIAIGSIGLGIGSTIFLRRQKSVPFGRLKNLRY